jgi:transcriptional regulator GlxA family with amidase domain
MALAIVERDQGRAVANAIAAGLVLYLRRPGFQSQFSDALVCQSTSGEPLGTVVSWIRGHLRLANVESVARAAAVSVRTFHRRCRSELGVTPAKLIDKLRVEHARTLLATSDVLAKSLADQCGFGTATNMKRVFLRELGVGPREYRLLHSRATPKSAPLRQRT